MTWVRLEANALRHPKLIAVGGAGIVLYLRSIGYAAEHLTDGLVPKDAVPGLLADFDELELWPCSCPRAVHELSTRNGVTDRVTALLGDNFGTENEDEERRRKGRESKRRRRLVKKLVSAGLWVETSDGYRIHDYLDYQPTAAATKEAKDRARELTRERVRRHRSKKRKELSLEKLSTSSPEPPDVTHTTIRSNPLKGITRNAVTSSAPSGGPPTALRPESEVAEEGRREVEDLVRRLRSEKNL